MNPSKVSALEIVACNRFKGRTFENARLANHTVFMCVCVCIYIRYTQICIYTNTHTHTHKHIHMHICTYIRRALLKMCALRTILLQA